NSCFSKSGTAAMGLNAALTNLDLLRFDPAAFEFDAGQQLTRDKFLQRLSDVLIHCLLCTTRIGTAGDPAGSIGVLGVEKYREREPERWKKIAGKGILDRDVDASKYRAVYATDERGRRLLGVQVTTDPRVGLPAGEPLCAAYRYLPRNPDQGVYGAYHTA